jgi:3-keto-5-aminohexanoate cleavage enzyme
MSNIGGDDPVIVTCALTGGIHGKEANSNLPEQPDEFVEQGVNRKSAATVQQPE